MSATIRARASRAGVDGGNGTGKGEDGAPLGVKDSVVPENVMARRGRDEDGAGPEPVASFGGVLGRESHISNTITT